MKSLVLGATAWGALGVKLETHVSASASLDCDDGGRAHAASLIGARHWEALHGHPCVPHETLLAMASGAEDPADAVEFLGREFGDVVSGERQAPHSLLSVRSGVVPEHKPDPADAKKTRETPACSKTLLPKLIYIGVGHSGSTSLADAMDRHPDLSFGKFKEHNILWKYHGNKEEFLQKYGSEFPVDCGAKIAFDASPRVLFFGLKGDDELEHSPVAQTYGLGVPAVQALKDLLGADTKFMLMYRDPVPWAMSNQVQGVIDWSELDNVTDRHLNRADTGFGAAFTKGQTLTHGMFSKRACYADALENWYKVFPKENFLHLSSEAFFSNPQGTLDKVCDFAGVSRRAWDPEEVAASGRRRNAAKAKTDVHERFHALPWARDCRNRLENMTGIDFGWEDPVEEAKSQEWRSI